MIQQLLDAIPGIDKDPRENGVAYNVIVTGAIIYAIYLEDGAQYYAKITDKFDMKREFDGTSHAYKMMPDHVAEPIAFLQLGKKQAIVCRGVPHEPLIKREAQHAPSPIADQLLKFFHSGVTAFRTNAHTLPTEQQIRLLCADAISAAHSRRLVDYFSETNSSMLRQPAIVQHGDFTVNNIGKTPAGLVYFDWEDYGKITANGFDLCMLTASTLDFDANRIRAVIRNETVDALRDLVERSAIAIGLGGERFFSFLPYYLLLNAYLKEAYGKAITSKNIQLANVLLRSDGA